jgi:hypothetical protein
MWFEDQNGLAAAAVIGATWRAGTTAVEPRYKAVAETGRADCRFLPAAARTASPRAE